MNPIKKFFNKIKTERQFKEAGPGHKLSESHKGHAVQQTSSASSSKQASSAHHQLSEGARRAGQAALARVEQKQTKPETVNWSLQATKAQARKEIELENAAKAKIASTSKNVTPQQDNSMLSVSGVYFKCPIIGPEVLPKKEMEEKIKQFLYEQLEEEKGLTACLIIHTLNRNNEKLSFGIQTLARYLTNILDNPEEEKYRKIRVNNKVFQERIIGLEGAYDFLTGAGFSPQVIDNEEFLVFRKMSDEDFEILQMLKEAILAAEPIRPILDRNLKVLRAAQAAAPINLPNDFFNLSAEEIRREQEAKAEAVELMTQLRTKAMRERDENRESRIYKFTLIRIRFPDGIIIQGTFYVYEKLIAVKEFVTENLENPNRTFHFLLPGGSKLADDSLSLLDLKLVPAVLLNLLWQDDCPDQSANCLNLDALALLSDL